jgi:hypothetical protein
MSATAETATDVRPFHVELPLIMTHGWPGSVIELLETIEPLTDQTAHGGSAEDAFHQTPRNWADQIYPTLSYFNEVDKGGHFAAWEEPELFSQEVRAGFRSLR